MTSTLNARESPERLHLSIAGYPLAREHQYRIRELCYRIRDLEQSMCVSTAQMSSFLIIPL